MKTYYSIRCWLGIYPEEDMCRVSFEFLANAKAVYEAISATMEYDRVQLVMKAGCEESVISETTKEQELYNLILS